MVPGSPVDLSLKLTDDKGQPVEGSWSLTLFDRSVLAIQPEIAESPMQHFHERRWRYVLRGTSSMAYRSPGSFSWNPGFRPVERMAVVGGAGKGGDQVSQGHGAVNQ